MALDCYNAGSGNWIASSSTLAHGIGTGSFTVGGWVYPTAIGSGTFRAVWSNGNLASSLTLLLTSGASAAITAYYTDGPYVFSTTLTTNTWQHIALRRSGTTITLWVNGVQDATTWSSFALSTGSIGTATQYVGGADSSGYIGRANVADWALWSSALSAGEILALARRWSPGKIGTATRKLWLPLGGLYGRNLTPLTGALTFTAQNGAAGYVEHPPIMYGDDAQVGMHIAGSTAKPWLYARRTSRVIGGSPA